LCWHLQVFQGGPRPPKPAETEVSEGGGLQLPSIGLPSISLPSISLPSIGLPALPEFSGLNITPVETLDPRTVALPGEPHGLLAPIFTSLGGGPACVRGDALVAICAPPL
jgi:hypothetical protein